MGKIGRNDPCPCGSGKKYKKCCLRKEEEERRKKALKQDADWEEDEIDIEESMKKAATGVEECDDLHGFDEFAEFEPGKDVELLPVERDILGTWEEKVTKVSDPDELHKEIVEFVKTYPELSAKTDLVDDTLFELGEMYFAEGRYAPYIELLEWFSSNCPSVYEKSFSFYDNYRVYWYTITHQRDKVKGCLDSYRKAPDTSPDRLFDLICFMMSWNFQDILTDFLLDIWRPVYDSPQIIGAEEIVDCLIPIFIGPHMDRGIERLEPEKLAREMHSELGEVMDPVWLDPEWVGKRARIILGAQTEWNLEDVRMNGQRIELYDAMTSRFMGWLVETSGVDWCCAEYHRGLVYEYLMETLPKKKKKKKKKKTKSGMLLFSFSKDIMEYHLSKLTMNLVWVDPIRLFGMLNALYYFQDFLEEEGGITHKEAEQNRETCVALFEKWYPRGLEGEFKTLAWKEFPRPDMARRQPH